MEEQDYYKILRVAPTSNTQEIRSSYRKLAFEYHPDRNGDNPDAAAKMKSINEAYAILSDPQKKAQYDTLRKTYGSSAANRFKQNYSDQDIFRGSDIGQIFEELSRAFGLRGFEDVFKEAYGSGFRTFEFRRPNVYGKVFMGGQNRAGGMPRGFPLGGNLGKLLKYGIKKKWGIEFPEKGKDIHDIIAISPELMQSGGKIDYTCRKNDRELRITIPSGIREGQKIRLRQMGEPGKGGAEAGDLYVEVQARNPLLQKITRSAKGIFSSLKNLAR